MRMLNSKPHLPWICMGDFNEILFTDEKRGGQVRPHNQMQAFMDTLDVCGFVNLGFIGPKFTWYGNGNGHTFGERLDRGVAAHDWLEKYLIAFIQHMHCVESDHRPILLVLDPNGESHRWKRKPFWFEEMWLVDKGCNDTVLKA